MLEYHAAFYKEDDGWYVVRVLDFPGALSQGRTLKSARRMIRDALRGLAEWLIEEGNPLPRPNPRARDKEADYCETIPLRIRALTGATDETATASPTSSGARLHGGARRGPALDRD
jgi:predicted RNase H-like HicB family nuclease